MTMFHTIIGMPGSGKTTFLAALWHLITAGELDCALSLHRLEGDYNYLNSIVEVWQRCEKLPRTSRAENNEIAIWLKDLHSGLLITLNFADLSGETFHGQFANRVCTPDYVDGLSKDGGLLLFVNADRPHEAVTIMDAKGLLDGMGGDITEWSPRLVSEQAQLVDLLQCMQQKPFNQRKRRLAVVVSAWDVVVRETLTPAKWLETEMPFLSQFLSSNPEFFEVRVYGVSAQGGVVEGESRAALLSKLPSERILCACGLTKSSDMTLPLKWLSGSLGA